MADNEAMDVKITNSENGDASEFDDFAAKKAESDAVASDDHLKVRIEELEREKRDLVRENAEMKAAEAEQSEMRKAMESITKRAFELEGEVVRLQHDLVTAMNGGDEAGREIARLMGEIEELRREKSALSEKMSAQAEELKRSKSDSGSKINELEKTIEGLQQRESEAQREKATAEEQAKGRLDEMEREIAQLKKEKTMVEGAMGALEAELKKSEAKVLEMGERIVLLANKAKESEEMIAGMVEKAAQRGIDGIVEAGERDGGFKGLKKKMQLPAAGAVSAGLVVAALAVCYVRYSKAR